MSTARPVCARVVNRRAAACAASTMRGSYRERPCGVLDHRDSIRKPLEVSVLRKIRAPFWLFAIVCIVAACSGTDTPQPQVGDGCSIDSECNNPLVCAFRKCHNECSLERDCALGELCVKLANNATVCQLPDENRCTLNSDCMLPQICAVDGRCRNECNTFRDCIGTQKCVSHTCASPVELGDTGMLQHVLDGGGMTSDGASLVGDSSMGTGG